MESEAGERAEQATGTAARHLVWIAPLLAIFGLVSYYTVFVEWPFFRDSAWLNLLILVVACVIAVIGVRRAWSGGLGWKIGAVLSVLVSFACTGLLVFYTQVLSYSLPSADLAVAEGERIPDLTLLAQDGTAVDLGEAAKGPLILIFYRGHW